MSVKCAALGCALLAIGGMSDHIHVLLQFSPAVSLAQLIGEMKGASSHLMTHEICPGAFFKWQGGYGAFTLCKPEVPQVTRYIEQQRIHHANGSIITGLELHASPAPTHLS